MHKYYDWQLIESLPLQALDELLSYACKEETRLQKADLEKRLFPLWLVNYATAKIKGEGEVIDYEEFLANVFSDTITPVQTPKVKPKRTTEDIMAELMPLVEADKRKGD